MLIFLFVLSILQIIFMIGCGSYLSLTGDDIRFRSFGTFLLILGIAEIPSVIHLIS